MEAKKTHEEKARYKLYKNTTYIVVQVLETIPHKTAAVKPPASHLTNLSS